MIKKYADEVAWVKFTDGNFYILCIIDIVLKMKSSIATNPKKVYSLLKGSSIHRRRWLGTYFVL